MTIKPVSDLYLITYEDGRPYKYTHEAGEAIDAIGAGFKVEEFVSLDNHRAAMLQAGNSPSTPDGWIPVSERMPEKGVDVLACKINPFGGYDEIEAAQWHGGMKGEQPVFITSADTIEPEMWQTLPAAPREVE
ncbi:hypothetical protein E5AUHO_13620 [Citrobacter freundii]|nr:hypothetical protein E5AUHO_13620 [Citrobacter freundii]